MFVQIDGNVCQDPKKITDKFCVIRMAENYKEKGEEETIYIDVKVFEKNISDLEYYQITKGDRLMVSGRLVKDDYEKDGEKKERFAIIADSIKKIWKKPAQQKSDQKTESNGHKF